MTSHKRSAKAKQRQKFEQSYSDDFGEGESGFDALASAFEQEDARRKASQIEHDRSLYNKACASKNRYLTQAEAESTAQACAEYGAPPLYTYKCKYCKGWHLTHKSQ